MPDRTAALGAALALLAVAACGASAAAPSTAADAGPLTLRLGYFPNLTHATALIGVHSGSFRDALGPGVTLEPHAFNAGPEAVTAIFSGGVDAAFLGPGPTINAFVQSRGQAVRVVSGATSGGALLVVRPGISTAAGLKGRRIADPQLGGTQDLALRWYLKQHGLSAGLTGDGDVSIVPQDNAQTLVAFKLGGVDGAWLPEPWASRLVLEQGARVLVDERDTWPGGSFETAGLVVRTAFLRAHPIRVKALLEGLHAVNVAVNADPASAQKAANDALAALTGRALTPAAVASSWSHMSFTLDPLASTLVTTGNRAHDLGLLPETRLSGLYDLSLLNQVLAEHREPPKAGP